MKFRLASTNGAIHYYVKGNKTVTLTTIIPRYTVSKKDEIQFLSKIQLSHSLHEQVDILELLIGAGLRVTEADDRLSTPLHLASKAHNHVLVKALLASEDGCEAAVASANEFKMTPLAAAFWNYDSTSNMRKTVAELMNAGADPNILLPCKEFSYLQG